MHYYHLTSFTLVLIMHRRIFVQSLNTLSPLWLDETENGDLFDTSDQDIFENLDNGDSPLPAANPLDFLSGKSDSCNNFPSFRRIRVRNDAFCINDQSVPGDDDNPPLDLNEILAPARGELKTQEQIVNFICPAATFQGILDIPVCGHAGDFGVTSVTPPAGLFASLLNNFRLYHVTYATLSKLILVLLFNVLRCHTGRSKEKAKKVLESPTNPCNAISDSILL